MSATIAPGFAALSRRSRLTRIGLAAVAVLAVSNLAATAQVQVAENLLVNVDAASLPLGPVTTVTNDAFMGGLFFATGGGANNPQIVTVAGTGSKAVLLDGSSWFEHYTALPSGGGTLINAPSGINGVSPTLTIEVWALNPNVASEESMVSLARRGGPNGSNLSFGYGANGTFGAVGHWGPPDIGWNGTPTPGQWHHLVYTLEGQMSRLYVDGAQVNSRLQTTTLNIHTNSIVIGAQRNNTGTINGDWRGSMFIAKVRIHDGVLTPAQISSNYNLEKGAFSVGYGSFYAYAPAHRYTFNDPASADATGAVIADVGSVGGLNGTVLNGGGGTCSFLGTQLRLGGSANPSGPYVDLPNGLLSNNSTNKGGTGEVTLETWVVGRGNRSWSAIMSIGSTTLGELDTTVTSGYSGSTVLHWSGQIGGELNRRRFELRDNGIGRVRDTTSTIQGNLTHLALTWDEATGNIRVYENGYMSGDWTFTNAISTIDDVNVWLGRGMWADPNIQADYDEFRVYTNVLSPSEVLQSYKLGADKPALNPGALVGVQIQLIRTQMWPGTFQRGYKAMAVYPGGLMVDVTADPRTTWSVTDPAILALSPGRLSALAIGNAGLVVNFDGNSTTQTVYVVTQPAAQLAHRYSFDIDGTDSVGTAHGTAVDGAAFWDGTALVTASTKGHVLLPPGVITNMNAFTIEAWATFYSLANWCRLFDFGDQNAATGYGRYYVMMCPRSGNSDIRMSIAGADPGYNLEQVAIRPGTLDNLNNVHVACVYHPLAGYMQMFINGVLAAQNTNLIIDPSVLADATNYIGKSLYATDAGLDGAVDEFRIYSGVVSAAQLALNFASGPTNYVTDPGALASVDLTVPDTSVQVNGQLAASFIGNFTSVSGVNLIAYDSPVFTSSNPSIVTVDATGTIKGVGVGSATVTASYGGQSDSVTISVFPRELQMVHRYTFNTDGDASDSVGTAHGSPVSVTVAGGRANFDATISSYILLPSGVVTNLDALTVEAWASFNSDLANNARLFDFGQEVISGLTTMGGYYIGLVPAYGGPEVRATINDGVGGGTQQSTQAARRLAGRSNVHLVAVYFPIVGLMQLYLDGVLVAENQSITAQLSNLRDISCYLGRSLYSADPYLSGSIDEFRIYSGVMTPLQVAIDAATGPNTIVTNTGNFVSAAVSVPSTTLIMDQTQQARLLGTFQNVSGVNLAALGTVTWASTDTNVVQVAGDGTVFAIGLGNASIQATYNSQTYTLALSVRTLPLTLKHRYTFDEPIGSLSVTDVVSSADGTLVGAGDFSGTGQLTFAGAGYVDLPNGIISARTNVTIEAWIRYGASSAWQRVFDFGVSDAGEGARGTGVNYMFLAAQQGGAGGAPRFAVQLAAGAGEPLILNSPTALVAGQMSHLVVVYCPSSGAAALYQDGVRVGQGTTPAPLSAYNDVNNWLGSSQYSADGQFNGTYEEFRIWEGAMIADQVLASYATGPNQLPRPSVRMALDGSQVAITWPLWVTGGVVESTDSLTAPNWTLVPGTPQVVGQNYRLTVPIAFQPQFFRLKN